MPLAARTLAIAAIGLAIVASTADARQIRLRSAKSLREQLKSIPASALEAVVTGPVQPG